MLKKYMGLKGRDGPADLQGMSEVGVDLLSAKISQQIAST